MSPVFTKEYRSLISLSLLANVGYGIESGSHQAIIEQRTAEMQKKAREFDLTTGWEIVWGPVIFWYPDSHSVAGDHTWVLVGNPHFDIGDESGPRQVYGVSFAGTNRNSWSDIFLNLDIDQVVEAETFLSSRSSEPVTPPSTTKFADGSKAYIIFGAAQAVYSVVTTSFGNETLPMVLRRLMTSEPGAAFVFGGMSLGGAIAPVVAYGSVASGLVAKPDAYVLAIAGPTPGNISLSAAVNGVFKPTQIGPIPEHQINVNIVDDKDVVPHAWAVDTLHEIPYNFGDVPLELREYIQSWVDVALRGSTAAGVTFAQMALCPFTGPFYPPPKGPKELLPIISAQHVKAYLNRFGVDPLGDRDIMAIRKDVIADRVSPA